MKTLRICILFLVISACNAPRASYDYDEQVEFQNFRTYAIFPDFMSGLTDLDEKRLISSLHRELEQMGIPEAEQPDFFVNVYAEEYQQANRNSIGVGVGGTGGNIGVGLSGGFPLGGPDTYLSLTFDIIDAHKDELIWQSTVDMKFDLNGSPEKRQAILDKMVAKALERFPPEQ